VLLIVESAESTESAESATIFTVVILFVCFVKATKTTHHASVPVIIIAYEDEEKMHHKDSREIRKK